MFPGLLGKKILYLNDRHEEKDTEGEDRNKLYDKRILPLLDKEDLAIFGEKINSFLWDYYKSLGLANIDKKNIFYSRDYLQYPSLTKAVINNHLVIEAIKKRKANMLISYINSRDTQVLSQKINCYTLSGYEGVENINNKARYREIIQKLDFPLISGFRASNLKEAKMCFIRLKKQGFSEIAMKKERSVGGFGIFIVKTISGLEKRFKQYFAEQKNFLLEGFIKEIEFFPNVQYWINSKEIRFITASDQLFEKNRVTHKGNVFPSQLDRMPELREKIQRLSLRLCRHLQNQNCYGLIGIDYLITKGNNIYSTEANFRLNHSTFPALIIEKLFGLSPRLCWKTFTLKGFPVSFENLFSRSQDLFIAKKGEFGIFPIDIGILKTKSEGQFMAVAHEPKQADHYKRSLEQSYENIFSRKM